MRPIRIALTKGRLEEKSIEMFEQLGKHHFFARFPVTLYKHIPIFRRRQRFYTLIATP